MRSNRSENFLWNCPVKLSATPSPARKVAKEFWSAVVRHMWGSAEREIRVERDAVFFQEREKFRVEGDFFVVGFLILDVAGYGGD